MENIDIKKIINEIRNEIKEKDYTNDILDFKDIYDQRFLIENECNDLEDISYIETHKQFHGNRISVLIKKVIRKILKFYINPIIDDQNNYNYYVFKELEKINKKLLEIENKVNENGKYFNN